MKTQAHTEAGITVGLIDSLITIARVLVTRDWGSPEVWEALADIRENDDLKRIMDIGDLWAAKEYIKEQREEIDLLLATIEFYKTMVKLT